MLRKSNLAEIHEPYCEFVEKLKIEFVSKNVNRLNVSNDEFFRRVFQIVLSQYNPRVLDCLGDNLTEISNNFTLTLKRTECNFQSSSKPWLRLGLSDFFYSVSKGGIAFLKNYSYITQALWGQLKGSPQINKQVVYLKNFDAVGFLGKESYCQKLVDYFEESAINLGSSENDIFLFSYSKEKKLRNFVFSKSPVVTLLLHQKVKKLDLIILYFSIFKYFVFYILSLRINLNSLMGKDFAEFPIFLLLARKSILSGTVCTNNEWYTQEAWTNIENKKFENHFLWCSTNSVGFNYKGFPRYIESPWAYIVSADIHWVWDKAQENWVKNHLSCSQVNVVGPIMFKLPSKKLNLKRQNRVIVFDINPVKEEVMENIISKYLKDYYTYEVLRDFIEGILTSVKDLNKDIQVVLKHKRDFSKVFDSRYIEFIEEKVKDGSVLLIEPSCNIWDEVKKSKVAVSVPFTSTAKVARDANVKSIYYDPSGSLDFDHFKDYCKDIDIVQDQKSLSLTLGKLF